MYPRLWKICDLVYLGPVYLAKISVGRRQEESLLTLQELRGKKRRREATRVAEGRAVE